MQETGPNSGYFYNTSENSPHLGGNIVGGDPCTWTPTLWSWLIKKFNIKTVVDIGCGEGHTVKYFIDNGCSAYGLEGLSENLKNSVAPMIQWDITQGHLKASKVDLVWCCELVEHIDAKYIHCLMNTLTVGTIVAMTHALPGQEGYHHVNCQPASYWIKLMDAYGFDYLEADTIEARTYALPENRNFKLSWFSVSGLIFKRR